MSTSDRLNALDVPEYLPMADACPSASAIVKRALGHMEDRAQAYDAPSGERSMGRAVEAFNTITGKKLSEEQGWLFMVLLKAVRSQQGKHREDNYEDGAAYFALMGEAAAVERTA
jgi:ketol-acid reductoisomerase